VDYDFIIIGSGFGGSVSALRLSEKGYTVGVLEMGKRYAQEDFPKTNREVRKFLWMPQLFCHGIQQITILRDVFILHGAGVGGGSLVYANTLLEPVEAFYKDPKWAGLKDWKAALAPHFQTAKRMLGAVEAQHLGKTEGYLRDCAEQLGRGDHFRRTTVGVYFGEPEKTVPDPFFDGKGPERTGCKLCGACMVGCRHGAKNTLDRNYLYLAEKLGTEIIPETRVVDVVPRSGGGYDIVTECSTKFLGKGRKVYSARNVVFSAGVLGTVKLLYQCKERGSLPKLSRALGTYVRTNSEALVGIKSNNPDEDFSEGIAIAAGFFADDNTHIEAVRYNKGSDFMGLLATVMVGGGPPWPRPVRFLGTVLRHPINFVKMLNPIGWAKRSMVLLVMQDVDNSLQLRMRRRWWWPFSRKLDSDRGERSPVPTYIPLANQVAERIAKNIDGTTQGVLAEVLLDLSSTAHILGGCPIGVSRDEGVIDQHNRVFGYEGLFVVDGSMIPANLGVNPSLTITAMAEHAMGQIPAKGAGGAGDATDQVRIAH